MDIALIQDCMQVEVEAQLPIKAQISRREPHFSNAERPAPIVNPAVGALQSTRPATRRNPPDLGKL